MINIRNIDMPYEININKRLKYMRMSIDTNGIKVSLPRRTSIKEIEGFLKSRGDWIYEHYIKFQSVKVTEYRREWQTGERIPYRGRNFEIIVYDWDKKGVRARFNGERFEVYAARELTDENRKSTIREVLCKLYIKLARDVVNERLAYYSSIIGVSYNDVRIKEQKTRWGSCSGKGNLNFNWKLVTAPMEILDYVIIHELCHLRFLNHSKQFWHMVEMYMPDYNNARKWLKDNGMRLGI